MTFVRLCWIGFVLLLLGYEWATWWLASGMPLVIPIVMTVIIVVAGVVFWRLMTRPGGL